MRASWQVGLAGVGLVAGGLWFAFGTAGRPAGPDPADPTRLTAGIEFFEARWTADDRDYLAGRQLIGRYVTRFGLSANLADVDRAESIARRLTETSPEPASAWSALSGLLLMQHRFADAAAAADSALVLAPDHHEAIGAAADAALARGEYPRAEALLRRLPPGAVPTLTRWASFLDLAGRSTDAAVLQDRACRALARSQAPAVTQAWCLTQQAGMELGDNPDAARARLDAALALQPGYRGAIERLGGLAENRGDAPRATALYRQVATDAHPDLYLRLAAVEAEAGRPEQSRHWEVEFERAALGPDREALYGPAVTLYYLERDRVDDALAVAHREIGRRPTVESWDLLAWVLLRRGALEAALVASDRAIAWGEPSPTIRYTRGRILEAAGRQAEAAPWLTDAYEAWAQLAPHARRHAEANPMSKGSGWLAQAPRG